MHFHGKYLHLLVVEDNDVDFALIEDYLNEQNPNLRINHAETFFQARDKINSSADIDAVLLDLSLPDARGEKLVADMIGIAGFMPVIVLTGYGDKDFGVKAMSMGVSDFLAKDGFNALQLYKSITYSIERKRISEKLNESEEKHRNLFRYNPVPMWVYDPVTLKFKSVNAAAIKHYGYSEKEFLSMNILDIRPSHDHELIAGIVKNTLLSMGPHEGIDRHYKKDGSLIQVNVKSNTINFDGREARLVAITDITRQKEEEQRLKLLESVITHATDAVMVLEINDNEPGSVKIMYVNESFTKMSGYTLEEISGKTPALFSGPESSTEQNKKLAEAISRQMPCNIEIINYKKSGDAYWVEIAVAPVTNVSGKVSHFIAIEKDITNRKLQEQEQEKLIHELTQNNSDLRQFSYITSHNLRGPIASLLGLCTLLDHFKIEDPTLKQILDGVKKATDMFDGTIKDLTTVLNVRDRTSIPRQDLLFLPVYEKSLAQSEVLIDYCGAEISADFSNAPIVNYNKAYLESIFSNLLTNAIKYRSLDRRLKINVVTENSGDWIVLKFIDNGLGIDLDLHKEKMFRLHQRFHDHAEGKGLGLFLIRSQLEALSGSIDIESKVGVGTTFILKFKR